MEHDPLFVKVAALLFLSERIAAKVEKGSPEEVYIRTAIGTVVLQSFGSEVILTLTTPTDDPVGYQLDLKSGSMVPVVSPLQADQKRFNLGEDWE